MAVATTQQRVLSDDILARCAERAPIYDRENRFFTEDFEELRQAAKRLVASKAIPAIDALGPGGRVQRREIVPRLSMAGGKHLTGHCAL